MFMSAVMLYYPHFVAEHPNSNFADSSARQAMVLDIKLNTMQHSAGQLRKLIAAVESWRPGSGHGFRAPKKPPKRIY